MGIFTTGNLKASVFTLLAPLNPVSAIHSSVLLAYTPGPGRNNWKERRSEGVYFLEHYGTPTYSQVQFKPLKVKYDTFEGVIFHVYLRVIWISKHISTKPCEVGINTPISLM